MIRSSRDSYADQLEAALKAQQEWLELIERSNIATPAQPQSRKARR